jgi:hypothetical protein
MPDKDRPQSVPERVPTEAEILPLPTNLGWAGRETRRLAQRSENIRIPLDVMKLSENREIYTWDIQALLRQGEIRRTPRENEYGILEWEVEHLVRDRYVVARVSKGRKSDGSDCLDVREVDWRKER